MTGRRPYSLAVTPYVARARQRAFNDPQFRIAYRAPSILVYESLLDLATGIQQNFGDLGSRDMIDVQSVIWVVGGYCEGRDTPQ